MATPSYAEVKQLRLETGNPALSFLEAEQILKSRGTATPPAAPVAATPAKPIAKPVAKPATAPISAKAPPIAAPAAPKPSVMLPPELWATAPQPATPPPAKVDASPVSITGTPIPFGLPIVIQPQSENMKPRLPQKTSVADVKGYTMDAYEDAKDAIKKDKSLTETGKALQLKNLETLYSGGRDVSGELSRTPTPTTVKRLFGEGYMGTVLGALAPQTIMTAQEVKDDAEKDIAAYQYSMDYKKKNPALFEGLSNDETAKALEGIRYYYKTGKPLEGGDGLTPQKVADFASGAFKQVTQTKMPSGAIVESPITTAGKLLNVAEAAVVAGGRSGVQYLKGEEVTGLQNLEAELKNGAGFMGAGEDIGRVTGDALTSFSTERIKSIKDKAASEGRLLNPDEETKIKNEEEVSQIIKNYSGDIGGFVGFVASILTPGDLGVSSAFATGGRTASKSLQVAKAFKPEITLAGKAGVAAKGFGKGLVEGGFDAWKLTPRTAGNEALSDQLESSTAKLLQSGDFQVATKNTLDFAANPKVADILNADKKAAEAYLKDKVNLTYDPATTKAALKAEFESGKYPDYATFEEFQEAAQRYGIDAKRLPGERVLQEAEVPQNVLSLEAEAAKRKVGGTGPMRTASLEDLALSGNKSDLHYLAMLDDIDDSVKQTLREGAAIKKTDLLPAIDTYMNSVRARGGNVAAAAESITSSLSKRGIEIGDRAYGGAKKSSVGSARLILPQDTLARNAIDKAFRIDVTRNFLNNFTKETGITGMQAKIGGITASVADTKGILQKVKAGEKGAVLDAIRERLKKSAGKEVQISQKELDVLNNYYVGQFKTGEIVTPIQPTEMYSPEMARGVLSRIDKGFDDLSINAQDFNQLVRSSIAIESGLSVTAKTESKLFEIGSALTKEGKVAEYNDFLRNVYKPKDFTESALGAMISNDVKSSLYEAPTPQSSISRGIVAEVNGRFSMLQDRFKFKMNEKLKFFGGNRPEAFSAVMIEEFTTGVVQPQNISTVAGREAFEMDLNAGTREMFRTNLASMFGAYERTGDIISSTSGIKQVGKTSRITVEEMRDLVTVMMHIPGIEAKYVNPFIAAVRAGEHTQSINILQKMHADYFGYSIQQILTKKAGVPEAGIAKAIDEAAKKAAGDITSGASFESATVSGRNGVRSPIKAYEAASSQGMTFKPENFKELLVANYYAKSQTNIINDVMMKASETNPGLFPTEALIVKLSKDDFEVTMAALIRASNDPVLTQGLLNIRADADVKKLMQAAIKDSIKKESLSTVLSVAGVESEYVNTLADIIKKQTKDPSMPGVRLDKKALTKLVDDLASPPGSTYTESFGSMVKPEASEATMANNLARLNDSLRSPYSSSIQGAVDRMTSIPSIREAAAGIKGEVIKGANIKSLTETLDSVELSSSAGKLDEALALGGDKMIKDIVDLEDIVKGEVASDLSKSLEKVSKIKVKAAKEAWRDVAAKRIMEWAGGRVVNIYNSAENFAKGGVLAGEYVANLVYISGNIITGPSIVAQTIGLREGLSAAKGTIPFLDMDTWNVLSQVYAPKSWLGKEKYLFTAPDGTIYTTSMIRDNVIGGALGKSQASAELTTQLIEGAIDWAGNNGLMYAPGEFIRKDISKGRMANFLKRRISNVNDVNMWGTFANMCDNQYRTGVFIRALKRGEGIDAASKLARESLFDYGKLTDIEKNLLSKIFWFWNFRRNNAKSLMTAFLMDPRSVKSAFAQTKGWSYVYNMVAEDWKGQHKMDQDYAMKDYSQSRAFLSLVEDPENKRRYAVYGPVVPAVSAVSDLIDYLSLPIALAGAKAGVSPEMTGSEAISRALSLVISQSSPLYQTAALAAGYKYDVKMGGEISGYLDPKLMYWVRQNESASGVFDTYVVTEVVPKEEEKPWLGYYQGHQWRIPKNDDQSIKNWSMIQNVMTQTATKRMASDYAPVGQLLSPIGEGYLPESQVSVGNKDDILRAAGITNITEAPLVEEARIANIRAAQRDIAALSKTAIPAESRLKPPPLAPPGPNATPEQIKEYKRKMNIK